MKAINRHELIDLLEDNKMGDLYMVMFERRVRVYKQDFVDSLKDPCHFENFTGFDFIIEIKPWPAYSIVITPKERKQ